MTFLKRRIYCSAAVLDCICFRKGYLINCQLSVYAWEQGIFRQALVNGDKNDPLLPLWACWLFDRTVYHTLRWVVIASDCSVFLRSGCIVCECVCARCGFFRKLLSHTLGLEPGSGDGDGVWLPEPLLRLLEPWRPSCVWEWVCIVIVLLTVGGVAEHELCC